MTKSRVSRASGLLKRKIRAAAGVRAVTIAAIVAAAGPNERLTARNRTPTVATPVRASGRRTLHELSPKIRTDRPMSIVESGGLSPVMALDAAKLPKNQADQLWDADSAAAEL